MTSLHSALDSRIFYRECRSLVRAGYDVVIVAPGGVDRIVDGVRIRAVPPARNRLHRFLVTGAAVLLAALRENCDVYHFHDPELMGCGLILRALNKRVVYDSHEDVPKDVAQKRYIPRFLRRPAAFVVRHISRMCTSFFDATVIAVPAIADGVRGKKVVIRNYPVVDDLLRIASPPWSSRSRAAIYAGSITESLGLREMIAAMSSPELPADARLTLVGAFADAALLARVRAEPNWSRVELAGWKEGAALWETIADAKVGLVVHHPTPTYIEGMPTKLFEYMALGLPVVASDFPGWPEIVRSIGCGLLVDPLDAKAIGQAISYLLRHPAKAREMGENGRAAVIHKFNWRREELKLLSLYANLSTKSENGLRSAAGSGH
ncbi:MAG: glycosyltransferase family 4 protein [Candidatus Eremiobacteraeota bacterium]|nr:glycosyltransferase family 4 protein [Candidatus Eremiobacteraeota bacterium]MBV8364959.1 glycosyltransferase family 4 protein [Candidatus Eremiobacteraeota bacterium]